jgi:hypothetical protein
VDDYGGATCFLYSPNGRQAGITDVSEETVIQVLISHGLF